MKYRTIVVDPPWRYYSSDILTRSVRKPASVATRRDAEGQYTTMTNEDIAAIPVGQWTEPNACLYLWVTNPIMFGGRRKLRGDEFCPRRIIETWGFTYKTMLTWVKTGAPGLGFYFRGNTEHVLFCTRGDVRMPPAARESNVIVAPRRGHSEKPDAFYDLVERVSEGPYLEMFARRARFGWSYWGDESLGTAIVDEPRPEGVANG